MTSKWKKLGGLLRVQKRMCATCIYRSESPLDLAKLENDVREKAPNGYDRTEPWPFFEGYRICHHSDDVCCVGFWVRHKDHFAAGQIAQRLGLVQFVDVDTFT